MEWLIPIPFLAVLLWLINRELFKIQREKDELISRLQDEVKLVEADNSRLHARLIEQKRSNRAKR